MTDGLPHRLTRTITLAAPRELVFQFLSVSDRWAAWWGSGSVIDAHPGGAIHIRHPNGVEVSGQVLDVRPPEAIAFSYAYTAAAPDARGPSQVAIELVPVPEGTRLTLTHAFADVEARDNHVQGWRYQLSVLANVVSSRLHAGAEAAVDAWFALSAEPDDQACRATAARIAAPDVRVSDSVSHLEGLDDLVPHLAAFRRFMPGQAFVRHGAVRECQGTVLADWRLIGPNGQTTATGTSVFVLGADGRIQSVTGFRDPQRSPAGPGATIA